MPQDKKTSRKKTGEGNLEHLRYLEKMDQVNRAMQGTNDLEQIMKDVLDALLAVYECDRAWLVYPCDPQAATWQTPMERTRPEYPGVLPIGVELPLDPVGSDVFRILRNATGPVKFGPGFDHPVPVEIGQAFKVESFIAVALHPKIGKPWSFGLHQCSYPREWTSEEERLFQEIGRRLSDTLTSLLAYRNLQESESQVKQLIDFSPLAMIVALGNEQKVELVNDKFIELFGYTIEDMPDVDHWWPLAYPDPEYREAVISEWEEKARKAIQDKDRIEPMEVRVTCKDGSIRYVEVQFSSIGNQHLVIFVDLTERKRAEDALQEREKHSQSLLRLSRKLEQSQTYANVLNAAQDEVRDVIGYQNLWAYLFTPDKKQAKALFAKGPMSDSVMSEDGTGTLTIQGDRMMEEIVEAKKIVVVEDARTDERTDKKIVEKMGNRTIVNVPIILFDRHLGSVGTGTFGDEGVLVPTASEQEYLKALASQLAVTLDRIHLMAERRQAELSLRKSEEKYRALAENIPNVVFQCKNDSRYTFVYLNNAIEKLTGYSRDDFLEKELSFFDLYHPDDLKTMPTPEENNITDINGNPFHVTYRIRHKSGEWRWVDEWGTGIMGSGGKVEYLEGIMVDITERKHAEDALRRLNRELQAISNCNQVLMRAVDEQALLNDICHIVCDEAGYRMAWVGYAENDDAKTVRPVAYAGREDGYLAVANITWADTEHGRNPSGTAIRGGESACIQDFTTTPQVAPWCEDALQRGYRSCIALPLKDEGASTFGVLSIYSAEPNAFTPDEIRLLEELAGDLAFGIVALRTRVERDRAGESLRESERRLAESQRIAHIGYWERDYVAETITLSEESCQIFGLPLKNRFLKLPEWHVQWTKLIHPEDQPGVANVLAAALRGGSPYNVEYRIIQPSGEIRFIHSESIVKRDAAGRPRFMLGMMQDITERKQHEREREAIITVSAALRQAATRADILNIILDQLVGLFEADGAMLVLPNPQNGGFIDEIGRGTVGERMVGLVIPPGMGVCNWVITNKKPYLNNHADEDSLFYRSDLLGDSHCVACAPLIAQEQSIGVLWLARQNDFAEQDLRLLNAIADIAANAIQRVILHEQTELQLHHLIALHQIDIAISSNFDSNITLNVILHNVKNELEVDAVNILLLNPVTHTLDYAAGLGFRTRGIEQSHVKLADGYAGTAAREYRTASCPNLKLAGGSFSRSSLLAVEGFAAHFATPLIVKGQVKGVLELFHRKTFEPESEWISYFETLATQAAIAIESASLLESLQRSNAELMLAYDATIEGWSRALDLRDRETEGHTQRVTEMALELAEKMGMNEMDKQHIWRGSLLHDIGKMGVPDSILLKPGPLSGSEMEVMRRHPLYAYQMLSPIPYLKQAMEISYCHHEKWDGSGYPRGLKGEDIPLSARLFAVIDVFDALTSDRPYRKAWPSEDVYRYIEEQAGKHFDPRIAKIFLENRT